ncbi:MAG: N-6 DNA methylase [Bacteroidales bacterium]|nr:N-6 DNA methylase [Bacteroidales bacterium]
MAHNIKSIREQFKANGVFYSDQRMAELLKSLVPSDVTEVYDPTCGDGGLLSVFSDDVKKYGQELDPTQVDVARERLVNAEIVSGDTLKSPAFIEKRFKAIVANPPFSIKWTPPDEPEDTPIFQGVPCLPPPAKADYAFLLHILHCLAGDGTAAVVNFPGVCYRGLREGKLRRWMIERNYVDQVILMEGGYFVDTKIATVILVLKKNRESTSIIFQDHLLGVEREVPIAEIIENDYTLNVSTYVQPPEQEKAAVDVVALEQRARAHALKQVRNEIKFSLMVAKMEGWSVEPFLNQLHDLVNEFREHKEI